MHGSKTGTMIIKVENELRYFVMKCLRGVNRRIRAVESINKSGLNVDNVTKTERVRINYE